VRTPEVNKGVTCLLPWTSLTDVSPDGPANIESDEKTKKETEEE
jgi:hypothetical protein